jgi:hypothetical protein
MTDARGWARRIDALVAGIDGVSAVYPAQPVALGAVRRVFDADAPLAEVSEGPDGLQVTVSIGVTGDSKATARRVSDEVRVLLADAGESTVTVRVSRVAAS